MVFRRFFSVLVDFVEMGWMQAGSYIFTQTFWNWSPQGRSMLGRCSTKWNGSARACCASTTKHCDEAVALWQNTTARHCDRTGILAC